LQLHVIQSLGYLVDVFLKAVTHQPDVKGLDSKKAGCVVTSRRGEHTEGTTENPRPN